jgi:cysteine desulfurase/selenocysteine lyase
MLGTPAYEQLAAVDAAANWLMEAGLERVGAHESALFERLLHGLLADDRVTVYGPHDLIDRAPTLAFDVAGHEPEHVARALAEERIAVWDGDYYAVEVMASYGIPGAVRAGIAAYLTVDDVDRLLDAVAHL